MLISVLYSGCPGLKTLPGIADAKAEHAADIAVAIFEFRVGSHNLIAAGHSPLPTDVALAVMPGKDTDIVIILRTESVLFTMRTMLR